MSDEASYEQAENTITAEGISQGNNWEISCNMARYKKLCEKRSGGTANVHKMQDILMNRIVALKQNMKKGKDNRFEQEVHILSQLYHQNIMPIYDVGTLDTGNSYYTMKWIEGNSLGTILEKINKQDASLKKTYTEKKLLNIFLSACRGIQFAHEKNIIHRDIKPANIMIDEDEAVVCDWGIAKNLGTVEKKALEEAGDVEHTKIGKFLGTMNYAAPEQLKGDLNQVGIRSDIYSLGVVLHEIIFGTHPYPYANRKYPKDDTQNMLEQISQNEPAKINKNVSQELEAIIVKAKAIQIEKRYPSVKSMILDIENYLAGRPVSAYHYGIWKKLYKYIRLRPILSILYLLSFLFIIVMMLAFYVNYHRAILEEYNHFNQILMTIKTRLNSGFRDREKITSMLAPVLNTKVPFFHREIGKIYFAIGDMENANKHYNLAEKFIGDIRKDIVIRIYQMEWMCFNLSFKKGQNKKDKYLDFLSSFGKLQPTDPSVQEYCEAFKAIEQENPSNRTEERLKKLIQLLTSAKNYYPEIGILSYYMGMYYYSLWELDKSKNDCLDKALLDYTDAIKSLPYFSDIYFNRHFIYDNFKRYSEALQDLQFALKNRSEKEKHIYAPFLVSILNKSERYSEALKLIQENEEALWEKNVKENLENLIKMFEIRMKIYDMKPSLLSPSYQKKDDERKIKKAERILRKE